MCAVSALVLGGCADEPVREPAGRPSTTVGRTTLPIPTTTLPDLTASAGLGASIRQFREDEVVNRIQVQLVRGRDDGPPIDVTSVRLRWPGFDDVGTTDRIVTVVAGQRVDVPTPLGAAICATPGTPSFAAGTVDVGLADGRTVVAPLLADAQTALDNVWGKECVRQRLLDRVGLTYAATAWGRSDPGGVPTATGVILVERRATDDWITVTGVDGSVLLVVGQVDGVAPQSPGVPIQAVRIAVTGAGRCDGHALSDSKKTYVFQVQVQIGEEEPVGVDLPVPEADRALLNQVLVDTCGGDHGR